MKRFIKYGMVIIVYGFLLVVLDFIIGMGIRDQWDNLIKWAHKK